MMPQTAPKLLRIRGALDPHVHLRGLEWSHKGTFASETAAALAGGFTAVLDMPNTPPPTVDSFGLQQKLQEMSAQSHCDYGVWLGANPSGVPDQEELEHLAGQVCGLKLYCGHTTGGLLINRELMRQHIAAWPNNTINPNKTNPNKTSPATTGQRTTSPQTTGPLGLHAEDGNIIAEFLDDLALYEKRGHICHIHSAQAVDYLRQAKQSGVQVTAGVSPHHLFLTSDDLETLGPKAVMKPPLGNPDDTEALWEALRDGLIDMVETDHAPHTWEEKQQHPPAFGVPGLETCLPLMCTAAAQGWVNWDQLQELVADAPRRVFGVGEALEGTYTLIDLQHSRRVSPTDFASDCKWSPYEGMEVLGKIAEVAVAEKVVFQEGKLLAKQGAGKNLFGDQP